MEKQLTSQCNQLLKRVKISNLRPSIQQSRLKQSNQHRLKSLAVYRRKLNQASIMKRQYSLSSGLSLQQSKLQNTDKENEKLHTISRWDQNTPKKPQFNLRKGTQGQGLNKTRKPFANLPNHVNKQPLTLSKCRKNIYQQNETNMPLITQNRLYVTSLVGQFTKINGTMSSFDRLSSTQKLKQQNQKAVQNATIVNGIFVYLKERTIVQKQFIGEFTQIMFKLICYFFVAYINDKKDKKFDQAKIIEFVEKEITQSYTAITSFKNSKNELSKSKRSLKSNSTIQNEKSPQMIRKSKRVSSFFKAVDFPQIQGFQIQPSNHSIVSGPKQSRSNIGSSQVIPKNALSIPRNSVSNNRRLSIMINPIRQAKQVKQNSDGSNSNITQRSVSQEEVHETEIIPKSTTLRNNVRRKSCFITDMKADINKIVPRKANKTKTLVHGVQFESSAHFSQQNSPTKSFSPVSSRNQLNDNQRRKSSVSNLQLNPLNAFSSAKLPKQPISKPLKSKQQISSKVNLNLHTPYDFTNEDTLITKRIKYLELHQKIHDMTQNLQELKNEEKEINQKIELRDAELIQLENRMMEISKEIQLFETRNKEAQMFLNGPQCPQMMQKIIKKKQQIKKNLTGLINSHAWYSSNLSQSTNAQHIVHTKQAGLQKLNLLTRKLRGIKSLEDIESFVNEMREAFLITIQKYSQIIEEFQEKVTQAESQRSNMLKNLEDWQMQTKIKEKLVNSSFLDYYSVERKVSSYIQKLPESFAKLQQYIYLVSQCRRPDYVISASKSNLHEGNHNLESERNSLSQSTHKKILAIEKEMVGFLQKIITENDVTAKDLYKQKRFAMVLQKIV